MSLIRVVTGRSTAVRPVRLVRLVQSMQSMQLVQLVQLVLVLLLVLVHVQSALAQSTVTHTGDAGRGSLREAIIEANRHPGPDNIQFDIPETDPGFNGTYWTITLESPLPVLTDNGTAILGFSQTDNQRDSNPGFVGSGGTVGVVRRQLPLYSRPEVAINAGGHDGLTIGGFASDILIEGISIFGGMNGIVGQGLTSSSKGSNSSTGSTGSTASTGSPGTNRLIREVLVGVLPVGLDPGGRANIGHGIILRTSEAGFAAVELDIERSFVGHNGQVGIVGERPATTLRVSLSEVFANGWATDAHDGIDVNGVNGIVQFNLSRDNRNASGFPIAGSGAGIEAGSSEPSTGDNLIENNTVRSNLGAGIAIRGGSSGNLIRSNIIVGNEVGIAVDQAGSTFTDRNIISENSTFRNRGIGIDLHAGDSFKPFDGVTLNSPTSGQSGPNLLQPYPIISSAILAGDTLRISGFASEGATIEVFEAEAGTDAAGAKTGFGEGRRHLFTVTESSVADLDDTRGEYGEKLDSVTVVSTEPLTTNQFRFVIPLGRMRGDRAFTADRVPMLTATERVSANTSEFGPTVRVARLPGRAEPISPSAGETNVPVPTTFTWTRAGAADTYELQVSTRRDPAGRDSARLVIDEKALTRPGYRTDLLEKDTRYFWRIRARNAFGVGRWSDPRSFATIAKDDTTSYPKPGLVYPEPEQVSVPLAVTFRWSQADGADRVTRYRFQLSKVPPNSSNQFDDTTFVPVQGATIDWILTTEQNYYWHVGAEYTDSLVWSDSIWTFTTGQDCAPLVTIALVNPLDGTQNVKINPTFNWQSRRDPAIDYTLEITHREPLENGDFIDPAVTSVSEPPFAGTTLAQNTTYYWRVRGNVCDIPGVWSKNWSFHTETGRDPTLIIGSVVLGNPEDDANGISTITPFDWQTATNAETYRIQISRDSAFAAISDGAADLIPTAFRGIGPLENGQTYYWRVRGENPDTVGAWAAASFTTIRYHGEFLEPAGKTRLAQNRPNPFNPTTTIDFEVKESSHVELSVYDIQGRLIRILESGYRDAGLHRAIWDGRDGSGHPAPSGVYVYRILAGEYAESRRMLLLK